MKKTAILLILITIISKLMGFAREIVLAYYYGASNISDAYFIAFMIPLVIFAFIGKAISTGYIPMYSKISNNYGENKADLYTNNLINVVIITCTIFIIIGWTFTEQIVRVFASGFEGDTLNLAISFTRISLLGIYFTALIHIFNAYLQLKGNFVIPGLIAFPMNFSIILAIIISAQGNTMVLAFGIVLAAIAQFIFLIPFIVKKRFRYKVTVNFKDQHIKNMAYLSLPIFIGVAVNDINKIVDRTIASQISEGGISALTYANTLNGFVQGIVVLSIATAMYPLISKMAIEENFKGLKKTLSEAISGINLLVIPAIVGAMILTEPIIELLFGRGAFGQQAINMTADALFFYAIGMIGIGLREVLSRPFYALQDTRTPMINATIGLVLNIILNIILSRYLGIGGLALATSIAAIFTAFLMYNSLRKKIGPFGIEQIIKSFVKILISSIIMGISIKLLYGLLIVNEVNQNLSLILTMILGGIIYFTIIMFMKINEVDAILSVLKKKINKLSI